MKITKTVKLERLPIYASATASNGKIIERKVSFDTEKEVAIINPGKNQKVMSFSPTHNILETSTLKYQIINF